jgi:hypothetical protein
LPARFIAIGVAWLAAIGLFAALIQSAGRAPAVIDARHDGVSALARNLNQLRPTGAGQHTWTVNKATGALRELVVEVIALHPDDAQRIAEILVQDTRADYDEVLVYVRAIDSQRDPVIRRIEWTPTRGFRASAF